MKIEIKSRFSGAVLFAIETDSWRLALEAGIKSGADLCGADLGENQVLQILGHKHALVYLNGQLRIGCHVKTVDDWRECAERIGKNEGYSPLDIEIYKLHIEHIARVAQLLWPSKENK